MIKKEKTSEFPNKPFTMANPLSFVNKVHENADNIQKLINNDKHVSSDNVSLKSFREEMKNGDINSSQYNANKEHKSRLDKTKGAIKQVVEALDKIETKNEEQDTKISNLESAGPVIVKDVDVVSSNTELKNNNIKQDIKVINDRLGKVEDWTPPVPEKITDENVASTNTELNNVFIKEDIKEINNRLVKVENWTPPVPQEIKDINVVSTTSLGNSNVKEDIEQLKTEIDGIDTGGGGTGWYDVEVLWSDPTGDIGGTAELSSSLVNYEFCSITVKVPDKISITGLIPTSSIAETYDGSLEVKYFIANSLYVILEMETIYCAQPILKVMGINKKKS